MNEKARFIFKFKQVSATFIRTSRTYCIRLLSEGTTYPTYWLLFETCLRLLSEGTTFPTYSLLFETYLRLLSERTTFPTTNVVNVVKT
jgi:hypothetical protein